MRHFFGGAVLSQTNRPSVVVYGAFAVMQRVLLPSAAKILVLHLEATKIKVFPSCINVSVFYLLHCSKQQNAGCCQSSGTSLCLFSHKKLLFLPPLYIRMCQFTLAICNSSVINTQAKFSSNRSLWCLCLQGRTRLAASWTAPCRMSTCATPSWRKRRSGPCAGH